jgi:hypothetical protein
MGENIVEEHANLLEFWGNRTFDSPNSDSLRILQIMKIKANYFFVLLFS